MFWFWFHLVLDLSMLALDAGWWVAVTRLTKSKLWRVLAGVFLSVQMAALLSLMCDLNWTAYAPKAVLTGVILWHFFGFAFAVTLLLLLGIVHAGKWMVATARCPVRAASSGATENAEPPHLASIVAQTSKSACPDPVGAVSQVSKPADDALPKPTWKSAIQQVWKPALRPDVSPTVAAATSNSLTRRSFLGACAALAPPLFTIGSTVVAMAQLNNLRVRRFTLSIPALPRALDGTAIAHVSDIHVGRVTSARVLREMVNLTNALRPDLVLMTGDLINYELADLSEGIALAQAMQGRSGLWMIEGNHDLLDDAGEFQRRVKAAGVPLLRDESAMATVRGHPVQLFGLSWIIGDSLQRDHAAALQLRELLKLRQPDAFPILLAHHPHAFDAAARADLPLTLSGHTHGGQLMLDSRHGVGPAFFRYWSGLYTRNRNRSQLVVSNGVGNWFPIRINAPAEILHLTLRCAESHA